MVIAGQHKHKTLRNPSLHEHSLFWLALPLCLLFGWWFSCLPLPLGNKNTHQNCKEITGERETWKFWSMRYHELFEIYPVWFHTDDGILDLHFLNFLGLKWKEESSVQNFTHNIPNTSAHVCQIEDFFTISFHDSFQITIPFVWAVNGQTAWRLTASLRPWIVKVKKGCGLNVVRKSQSSCCV